MTTVLNALNQALHQLMSVHPEILCIGEDIADPYGGAFKVTKGLSSAFGERVVSTPISEAGITGLGIGLALQGYRPIVEIMFGDFITLCADQLINQGSKINSMYNEPVPLPLVMRTPMGGRRGYGPTHSQTLESMYMGVPGLNVVAVSPLVDPGALLEEVVLNGTSPTIFIENKILYGMPVLDAGSLDKRYGLTLQSDGTPLPVVTLGHGSMPDVTIATYGGMTPMVMQAAARLRDEEDLLCEVVVFHDVGRPDLAVLEASLLKSRRLVVAEEGTCAHGWGAEIVAATAHVALEAPPQRVGAANSPIPVSESLENEILPQIADIIDAVIKTVDEDLR